MEEKPQMTFNFNAPITNNGGTITGNVYYGAGYKNDDDRSSLLASLEGQKNDDDDMALQSDEARALLAKAREHGWLDDQWQPTVSQPRTAILASVMADKLQLSPRWAAFEHLWGISGLASKLSKAQMCQYYSESLREFEAALL